MDAAGAFVHNRHARFTHRNHMTIGITGAAGFLGANVLRHLADLPGRRHRLVPFYSTRNGNPLTDDFHPTYEHLDVTSLPDVRRRTRHLDVLLHVAGRVDFSRRGARRTWEVNVLGTRNVLEAALANGIRKVVCVSSICVVGPAPEGRRLADEDAARYDVPANPISFRDADDALAAVRASLDGDWTFLSRIRVPYFDAKLAAWELTRDYHRRHGLPVVCVFPGTAVGAGDTGMSIGGLVERVVAGRLRVTLPGATSFVAACDAARGTWLAARAGRPGASYIISGRDRDNLSYRDFMALVARVARDRFDVRCPVRFAAIPAGPARWAARIAESVAPGSPLTLGLALSGSVRHRFSSRRAARELGYRPRQSLEDAVAECIAFNRLVREGP
jgi:dihydroflavonol-4-reductase